MKKFAFILFVLFAIATQSCKKEKVDPCVEKFVGEWNCFVNSSCNFNASLRIESGPDGGCQVLLPNLPIICSNSSNQILGRVTGDSIHVESQPFGLTTISAQGRIYLNQISLVAVTGDGINSNISGTK